MIEKTYELKLCPDCGSTEYMEDYPAPGTSICEDCGHQITAILLQEVSEEIEEPFFAKRVCSSCGGQDPTEKPLFDDLSFFRVVVYKCNACGKLDGYRILPRTWADNEEVDDGDFGRKTAVIAKTEGKFLYSASAAEKIGKGLKHKERDPMELCKRTFKQLVEQKSLKMLDMGVSAFTIG